MAKLPISKLALPRELHRVENGKLPQTLLVPCGIPGFRMSPRAAVAMRALVAAAEAAGFRVRSTGTYRSYGQQVVLFRSRYTLERIEGRPSRRWRGKIWWQLPRTAAAAVPGTSNHGLGLACDFAEERDGDKGVESVSPDFVAWLISNAYRFGFSAELQSEPWHWRYHAGDDVPPEVAAFLG